MHTPTHPTDPDRDSGFNEFLRRFAIAAPAGQRIVDIGAGDGHLSRVMAKHLSATMLHLVDDTDPPGQTEPACDEQQWRMSAEDPQLIAALQGKIDTIVAMRCIHEFEHPHQSVAALLRLFPQDSNGFICVVDYTRHFWTPERLEAYDEGRRRHAQADYLRALRTGLFEPEQIQAFWEQSFREAGHETPAIAFNNDIGFYWLIYPGKGPLWYTAFTVPEDMRPERDDD